MRKSMTKVIIPANPQTLAPLYTMQDFRLFQNFIKTAYPHHPIGNDSVWIHEIPNIAYDVRVLKHIWNGY